MSMNKLDLIFEKEPPEVQRKLMNLLIQYNAMMQYNSLEDKFEVDLLLPFQNGQQKKNFIANFNSRNQVTGKDNIHVVQPAQSKGDPDTIAHRHAQPNNKIHIQVAQPRVPQPSNYYLERDDNQQLSYELTNQNEDDQSIRRRNTISIQDVSSIIRNKLRKAIAYIRQKNDSVHRGEVKAKNHPQFESDSIKLRMVEQQKPIQVNERESKNKSQNSSFRQQNKILSQLDYLEQTEYIPDLFHPNTQKIFINDDQDDKNQHQQYDADFNHQNVKWHSEFQGDPRYKQVENVNNQGNNVQFFSNNFQSQSSKKNNNNQVSSASASASLMNNQTSRKNEKGTKIKQQLESRYKVKQGTNSIIRQKYSQFLRKNHKDFDRIYETIRKQIRRNGTRLDRSINKNVEPILILQENIAETISQDDRIFKEQILKEYQKQILVQNQLMSSEDLIKYFRYLLQNAKNLYVKQLRKKK